MDHTEPRDIDHPAYHSPPAKCSVVSQDTQPVRTHEARKINEPHVISSGELLIRSLAVVYEKTE